MNRWLGRPRFKSALLLLAAALVVLAKAPELRAQGKLQITTASLPPGILNVNYSVTMDGAGGTQPYRWSATGLPPGLSIDALSGEISGVPTSAGNFKVKVTLRDLLLATISKDLTLSVLLPLEVTTTSLPPGAVGTSYSANLAAAGGVAPYTWSVAAGSLPAGLSLSSRGTISGTPGLAVTATFTVQVTDSSVQTASRLLSLTIAPAAGSVGVVIATPSPLPDGTALTFYTATLIATGGAPPYTWALISGALPDGLNLSSDGIVSGAPTRVGTFTFLVQVTDGAGVNATKIFTVSIAAPPLGSFSLNMPASLDPAQQAAVGLAMSTPQPNAVSGSLKITFSSNTTPAVDDPAVLFSNGSRSIDFIIPANSTVAVFSSNVLLLSGTIAGVIRATVDVQNGPSGLAVGAVEVRATVPKVTNAQAARTANGVNVQLTAYSPDRKVISAEFVFSVKTPSGIQRVSLVRDVASEFAAWYASGASSASGSSFVFQQSFVVNGDTSAIQDVTVSLTNGQGTGSSAALTLSN